MLGDLPAAWPGYPVLPGLRLLWTALRVTVLHAIWCAHWSSDPPCRTAAAVVRQVVSDLQGLIHAQFKMAALSDATLDALPARLLTAELRATPLETFLAGWAHGGVLCAVDQPAGGVARLRVLLTLAQPVVAPGGA
jgi:hypothetical protein